MCSVNWTSTLDSNCLSSSERVEVSRQCISEDTCVGQGWQLIGDACNDPHITGAVPDVFLLSVILFLGTFTVAMTFRMFRNSRFFPTVVCDFNRSCTDLFIHSFIRLFIHSFIHPLIYSFIHYFTVSFISYVFVCLLTSYS